MTPTTDQPPTITCGGRVRRQAEAHHRAGLLATALLGAGVERGERVAVMARNDIEFLEVCLAIASAGANPVPINTRWRAGEVAHVLADCAPRIVFAHTEFVPVVEDALSRAGLDAPVVEIAMPTETLVEAGLDPAGATPTGRHRLFEEWIATQHTPVGHLEGAVADSMGLIYTSGTTGTPKGVLRERMTPHQLLSIAGGIAQRMGLAPGGRMLVAGPMYHTSPNAVAVLALRMGTDITIMPRWDSERFLQLVAQHRIQQAKIVPTMLSRLLSLPEEVRHRYDISSLSHLIHSAAPCPPAIKRAAIDWFGEAVIEYFGSTETGTITWIGAREWLAHPGSVGRPVDGSAVAILDEEGTALPAGRTGRVYVRGADYWPAFGYLHREGAVTAHDDLIWVGDTGHLDADGFLFLTGRSSEIVIRGGVNISPAEIENAVMAIPAVEDVAVFGVPSGDDLGEALVAYVVPRPGFSLDADEVRARLTGELANYKVPSEIRIVDTVPRDDSGKIYKRELRDSHR
ncbi:AMP-dependent synthetase [Nocardia mangyaensis]|uniref:AMP-dependent synthetase n=1 Tax=Nocardia mangyaensis TaxID=2213200 RepID=A0A1J0VT03_9NOCA|nr:AMP-binding protein [Nocardia mangyaensis]APE35179.1 AMP-dependent synthetase [Nocardia mangyaensis]